MTSQLNGRARPAAPGPGSDRDSSTLARSVWSRTGRHAGRRSARRERLVGLGAAVGTVLLLGGPPTALSLAVGWPLPQHLPTMLQLHTFLLTPLSDRAVLDVLATVGWLLWANLACAVLLELTAQLRGLNPPRLPLMALNQQLAHRLISATLLLLPASQTLITGSSLPAYTRAVAVNPYPAPALAAQGLHPARFGQDWQRLGASEPTSALELAMALATAPDPVRAGAATTDASAARPTPITPSTTQPVRTRPAMLKQYTVDPPEGRHHDSLWHIAARHLGDGRRYPEIFTLNHGRPQPDGGALSKASLIRPGWVLLLPADATGPDVHPATATPDHEHARGDEHQPEHQPAAPTGHGPNPPTQAQPPAVEAPTRHGSDSQARPAVDTAEVAPRPAIGPSSAATALGSEAPAIHGQSAPILEAQQPQPREHAAKTAQRRDTVVELLGLGLGAVAALAALTRARKAAQRRRRRGRRLTPTPLLLRPVETALRREAQQQNAIAAEVRATCALVAATTSPAAQRAIVAVLRHDDQSLELLTDPAPATTVPAPAPFTVTGRGWQLAATARGFLKAADSHPDPLPVLLPVGRLDPTEHDDPQDQGQLYVDLTRLGLISLTGSAQDADRFCLNAAGQLAGAPWAGLTRVLVPTALAAQLGGVERVEAVTDLTIHTPQLLAYAHTTANAGGQLVPERSDVEAPVGDAVSGPPDGDVALDDDDEVDGDEASSMLWMVLIGWDAEQLPAALVDAALDPHQPVVILTTTPHPRAFETWQLQGGHLRGILGHWQLELPSPNAHAADIPALLQHATTPDVPLDDPSVQALREDSPPQPPPELAAAASVISDGEPTTGQAGQQDGSDAHVQPLDEQAHPSSDGAERTEDANALMQIDILGPVQLRGAELPRRIPVLQVLVYLAVHRRGASADQVATALWPDKRVVSQTLRNRVGEARALVHGMISEGPGWRLDPVIGTDWQQFQYLASGDADSQQRALELVRGKPFEDFPDAEWIDTEGLRTQIESAIVDLALQVGEHALRQEQPGQAFWAARTGLCASPYEERLFRLAMRAADAEGATGKVRALMRELRTVLDLELEPDDTIQPETLSLYRELLDQPRSRTD